jgi:alpha-ketoglutarate-dependent taurine dioxygenase
MELVPLGPEFGVEVRGIGLIDVASSDSAYRPIRAALEEHSVLLFRGQEVADDVQAAFSRAFGPLERVKIGSVGAGTFYSRLHNIAPDGTLCGRCRRSGGPSSGSINKNDGHGGTNDAVAHVAATHAMDSGDSLRGRHRD